MLCITSPKLIFTSYRIKLYIHILGGIIKIIWSSAVRGAGILISLSLQHTDLTGHSPEQPGLIRSALSRSGLDVF